MQKKYFKGLILDQKDAEEIEGLYKLLAEHYTEEWLSRDSSHPIQQLWKREDKIANMELCALAQSIKWLTPINPQWVKNQVKTTKSNDLNNCKGAILELFCLGMMKGQNHSVIPAKLTQAGYDGTLKLNSGTDLRVSIKNYGMSEAQRRYEDSAEEVESIVKELLKKYDYQPTLVLIDSPQKYPSEQDWINLKEGLDEIFRLKKDHNDPHCFLVSKINEEKELTLSNYIIDWHLIIAPFTEDSRKYHPAYKTYTFIISGLLHHNEYRNIYGKITEACENLEKHSASETGILLNTIFIHIPTSISIEKCYEWIKQYFIDNPDKPISIVYLCQPAVVSDTKTKNENIHYCFKILFRTERIKQILPKINFTIPGGGILSDQPAKNTFVIEFPDGKTETSEGINDRYLYQRGNHYLPMVSDGKGVHTGTMQKIGTGIFTHSIIEIPDQPGSIAITPNLPPKDVLLIL